MSIIGVQISAAVHAGQHPDRVPDCMACDLRAGDYEAASANFNRQQAAAKQAMRRRKCSE